MSHKRRANPARRGAQDWIYAGFGEIDRDDGSSPEVIVELALWRWASEGRDTPRRARLSHLVDVADDDAKLIKLALKEGALDKVRGGYRVVGVVSISGAPRDVVLTEDEALEALQAAAGAAETELEDE